jgi:predicted permease
MLKNYFKIALRNLIKHRVYTFINIAGLALGMVCCILIFLWVQDEISFDHFHKKSDRLYQVVNKNEVNGSWWQSSPWALAPVLKNDFPEIEKSTRFYPQNMPVKYTDKSFYESIAFVDPDFLEMFSFPLIKGNPASALTVTESVIISEKTAQKYFKNEDPIGKVLKLNKNTDLKVTGVMKNVPANSSLTFDILVPIKNLGEDRLETWSSESGAFVLLKENTNVNTLMTKMSGTTKKYDKRTDNNKTINSLQPISRIHLYGLNSIGPILYIYIFSAVALIVLFVACINFINLITATASERGKEIGMRKIVGAGKNHIIWQFYGETFLLSVLAFILAYILALIMLPGFNELAGKQLRLNFIHNPILIIGSISIILFTTICAGSYPALYLSSFLPIKVLKESSSRGFRKTTVRWILVITQFAVSIILIVMTITMNKQIDYIQNINLGYNREQVISIPLNDDFRNQYEAIKTQLLRYPDIIHITAANNSPTNINFSNPVYWEGGGPDKYVSMTYLTVDYDFFETFEMKMIEGRNFSKDFSTDPQNYIVNEATVDFMKMKSPIGKRFSIWKNEGHIIGVVKNFNSSTLHDALGPVVITLTPYMPISTVFIRIKPENVNSTLAMIEKTWRTYVPNYPFQYDFLDDVFRRQYNNEEETKNLFQYFSALAIFISCIGLFGLAAFTAQRRTKEIGIRKVVGASVFDITALMLRDFAKWLLIAIIIGVPVSYYFIRMWLQDFAFRIEINWTIFAGASVIVLVIALATVSVHAIKAATTNPVEALRYE